MTYFLKNGNTYRVATPESLDLHETLPAGNYIIRPDQFGNLFLEGIDAFTPPGKIYGDVDKLTDRMINTFLTRSHSTGVLLTGEKGSGKTLQSKMLSIRLAAQGIPTIVINAAWKGDGFNKLLQDIDQPCMILFDEFEKVYQREDQEHILTLLDGVFSSKKLFVLTCNDKWRIDAHMRNRPGRIYYMLDYTGLESSFVREYCEDNLLNKSHIDGVCTVAAMFGEFNFDMLKAMVEEMNRYGETPQEVLKYLNAKPEFSNQDEYTVEAIVGNQPVPVEDLGVTTWTGNPLRDDVGLDVRNTVLNEDDDHWVELEITHRDLKKVDAKEGRFVFTAEDGTIILTRKAKKTFDYWGAF